MAELNIGQLDTSNLEGTENLYSPQRMSTDGAEDTEETFYDNTDWPKWFGYYKTIPELAAAIDAKATWTIGKGFKSNEITQLALMDIKGWGKDSFNTILENCVRTYHIGGDSFCEIIRDKKDKIVNLKPLDPETMRIVANRKGVIIRYEQRDRATTKSVRKFEPVDIFHLARNRVADEIHGTSMVKVVADIILMRNEAMADYRKLLHRNIYPVRIWHLDTDNTSKIAAFKAKADLAYTQGENIYVPMGTVESEIAAVPTNATLNPLPWINQLNNYFFQATGVPQIIVGGSQEITEASAKIAYLAFEQTIEEEQLFLEEQVLQQLNLEISLEFPASLQNEMLSDESKSERMAAATPEDTSALPEQTTPPEKPQSGGQI
jgi:hypothetical protein